MMILLIPQNLAPDLWSWTEFIRTITGPVIAAVVLIIGLSMKERFDRKSRAQQWFLQTYVTDGIDLLIAHLQEIRATLFSFSIRPPLSRPFSPLSLSVCTRMTTVVRSPHLFGVLISLEFYISAITAGKLKVELGTYLAAQIELATSYLTVLDEIREQFLQTKISNEKDVYSLAEAPRMRALTARLDKISIEFLDKQLTKIAKL